MHSQSRQRTPLGIVLALRFLIAASGSGSSSGGVPPSGGCGAQGGATLSVLVFSRTAGFRHGSIAAGVGAICAMGERRAWAVSVTEDPALFNARDLQLYDVVVWLNTTGNVLDSGQESAFQAYIESGGGYVGIHSAADTEYAWSFYSELVGGYFESHPAVQQATIRVEDATHPAMASLPAAWARTDEWYNFGTNPRGNVRVLASLDEHTYAGGTMGEDHPIVWSHDQGAGRAFYAGLGHTSESYSEPLFLEMIAGAIGWAGGVSPLRK